MDSASTQHSILHWERKKVIGRGAMGTVYEGITSDGKAVAVKVQDFSVSEDIDAVIEEVEMIRQLHHPNIVACLASQTTPLQCGDVRMEIFFELCPGGSLLDHFQGLAKDTSSRMPVLQKFMKEILSGLQYLHSKKVAHRDLSPANVLIAADGSAKLSGFGINKQPATLTQTFEESLMYMAPEVVTSEASGMHHFSISADIWSLGCTLLALLQRQPWVTNCESSLLPLLRVIAASKGAPTGMPSEDQCPKTLYDFLSHCFNRDTASRWTADQLLEHPWITCPSEELEEMLIINEKETEESLLSLVKADGVVSWERKKVIGRGAMGTVYEGITSDGKAVAVKVQDFSVSEDIDAVIEEVEMIRQLHHPNIVACLASQTTPLQCGDVRMEIFFELCPRGSLLDHFQGLAKDTSSRMPVLQKFMKEILSGLQYLHSKKVAHRDLSPANVLIAADGSAKLSGFGINKQPATLTQTFEESLMYMAPEVVTSEASGMHHFSISADIWSLGCTLLALLQRQPWVTNCESSLLPLLRVIAASKGAPTGMPPEDQCPKTLYDFLSHCFDRDTASRWTADQLLEHPWITCPSEELEEMTTSGKKAVLSLSTEPVEVSSLLASEKSLKSEELHSAVLLSHSLHSVPIVEEESVPLVVEGEEREEVGDPPDSNSVDNNSNSGDEYAMPNG